ncbi:MAG: hypothetical protein HYT79_00260 [Elusimicrobia bacterium]|nr:hypothetical protein [Elusimicrobiota bacterium]
MRAWFPFPPAAQDPKPGDPVRAGGFLEGISANVSWGADEKIVIKNIKPKPEAKT